MVVQYIHDSRCTVATRPLVAAKHETRIKNICTLCENEPFVVRSFTLRRAHAVVRSFVRSLIRDSVTSWCREYQVNFFFFFFFVGLESRILKGNECAF